MVFLTTTLNGWNPLFERTELARECLNTFASTLAQYQISLCAYVLMPSHIHALLGLKRVECLSDIVQNFKSISSRNIKSMLSSDQIDHFKSNGKFQLWRPRFDELIIWSEKQFRIKVDYIHNNPVKKGLVEMPIDFVYSSARDWLTNGKGNLPIDKEWNWVT